MKKTQILLDELNGLHRSLCERYYGVPDHVTGARTRHRKPLDRESFIIAHQAVHRELLQLQKETTTEALAVDHPET